MDVFVVPRTDAGARSGASTARTIALCNSFYLLLTPDCNPLPARASCGMTEWC
uniref:Uncharacterized protein n=1 Tax=Hyaloperonospora arabidopsidis (strain Emoy2) TaxID=559515 RepID=M4C4E2_HYAAE